MMLCLRGWRNDGHPCLPNTELTWTPATASSTMGLASTGARAPNRLGPPSLLVEKRGGRHNLSIRLDVRKGQKSMVVSQQVGWMAIVIGPNEEHTWRI